MKWFLQALCQCVFIWDFPNSKKKAVKFSSGVSEEHPVAQSSRSTHGMNVPV